VALDHKVPADIPAHKAHRVTQEVLVLFLLLDLMAHVVTLVQQARALLVLLEAWGRKVILDHLVLLVVQGHRGHKVLLDLLEAWDHRDLRV
jgi:hypothetical protein